jgi:hypothetical protein
VEGAHLRAARNDSGNDALEIAQNIARSDPHHFKPFFLQERIASCVAPGLVTAVMCFSVYLDNQAVAETREISRDPAHGKLRSKFQSVGALPKCFQE